MPDDLLNPDLSDFSFDDIFGATPPAPSMEQSEFIPSLEISIPEIKNEEIYEQQIAKRGSKDFAPDMDTLLLTAQSSMIIEGMKLYTKRSFEYDKLSIYKEALIGTNLYLKILNRSPENYNRIKSIISSDIDCQEVEKIANNLYHAHTNKMPETTEEKIKAYQMFTHVFEEACKRSALSQTIQHIKKYFLASGHLDLEKIKKLMNNRDEDFFKDIIQLQSDLQFAMIVLNKGSKDSLMNQYSLKEMQLFTIKTSELLAVAFNLYGNSNYSDYYRKINDNQTKYFLVR